MRPYDMGRRASMGGRRMVEVWGMDRREGAVVEGGRVEASAAGCHAVFPGDGVEAVRSALRLTLVAVVVDQGLSVGPEVDRSLRPDHQAIAAAAPS